MKQVTIRQTSGGTVQTWRSDSDATTSYPKIDDGLDSVARHFDPTIESIEVKRKSVEIRAGMVLESPIGRRYVSFLSHEDMRRWLIPLDFDGREIDIGPELKPGWRILPGRVEYVGPDEKAKAAEESGSIVDKLIVPGMIVQVETSFFDGIYRVVSVRPKAGNVYVDRNGEIDVVGLSEITGLADANGNRIWRRNP